MKVVIENIEGYDDVTFDSNHLDRIGILSFNTSSLIEQVFTSLNAFNLPKLIYKQRNKSELSYIGLSNDIYNWCIQGGDNKLVYELLQGSGGKVLYEFDTTLLIDYASNDSSVFLEHLHNKHIWSRYKEILSGIPEKLYTSDVTSSVSSYKNISSKDDKFLCFINEALHYIFPKIMYVNSDFLVKELDGTELPLYKHGGGVMRLFTILGDIYYSSDDFVSLRLPGLDLSVCSRFCSWLYSENPYINMPKILIIGYGDESLINEKYFNNKLKIW